MDLAVKTYRCSGAWGYAIVVDRVKAYGAEGFADADAAARAGALRLRRLKIMGSIKQEDDMAKSTGKPPMRSVPQNQPRESSGAAAKKVGGVGEPTRAASFPEAKARKPAQRR